MSIKLQLILKNAYTLYKSKSRLRVVLDDLNQVLERLGGDYQLSASYFIKDITLLYKRKVNVLTSKPKAMEGMYHLTNTSSYQYEELLDIMLEDKKWHQGDHFQLVLLFIFFQLRHERLHYYNQIAYIKKLSGNQLLDALVALTKIITINGNISEVLNPLLYLGGDLEKRVSSEVIGELLVFAFEDAMETQLLKDWGQDMLLFIKEFKDKTQGSPNTNHYDKKLSIEEFSIHARLSNLPETNHFYYKQLLQSVDSWYAEQYIDWGLLKDSVELKGKLEPGTKHFDDYEKFLKALNKTSTVEHFKIRLRHYLKIGEISREFFAEAWDYAISNQYHITDGIKTLIYKVFDIYIAGLDNTTEKLWYQKVTSGFESVTIPNNHNPYEGLHPSQLRPLFKILAALAKVDITKFYTVNKESRVKFIINSNHYEIITTDGFGYHCLGELNEILYQEKIPYQYIVITKSLLRPSEKTYQSNDYMVTLINEKNYKKLKSRILKQDLKGFYPSNTPVSDFFDHISQIKTEVKVNSNLDKIDLDNEPRFALIKEVIEGFASQDNWMKLLVHSLKHPIEKKAGKTWMKACEALVANFDPAEFQPGLAAILEKLVKQNEWYSDGEKAAGLLGFGYAATVNPSTALYQVLTKMIAKCYKKVRGGAFKSKVGAVVLEYLVKNGSIEAYAVLGNLKARATYNPFIKALNSRMNKFSALLKTYSPDELEDIVVPDYDLVAGKRSLILGDYECVLTLEDYKVNLTFSKGDKTFKSVPKDLKDVYKNEVSEIKLIGKGITETLQAQVKRLERFWLSEKTWAYDYWKKYYADHQLMKVITERLIWRSTLQEEIIDFLWQGGNPVNTDGTLVTIPENAQISLWHPVLSEGETVERWRDFIFDHQIKQPFKQAYREVYHLTPAEETTHDHSMRFSGHFLEGNKLFALGKNRRWTMSYEDPPVLLLPEVLLAIELRISGRVLYDNPTTEEVVFLPIEVKGKSSWINYQTKIPLSEVAPVLLSEGFRDIDLFVSVANTSADPHFPEQPENNDLDYWNERNFGESTKTPAAKIRQELLKKIIPKTKIADKCSFADNYLIVQGTKRLYKINFGSGNILMSPNDQYLCIVPANTAKEEKKVWLPFEDGDKILMIILSKAFLLVADNKITDPTILRQIN